MPRASSLNMARVCPGYVKLADAFDSASTSSTSRGTEVHDEIRRCIDERRWSDLPPVCMRAIVEFTGPVELFDGKILTEVELRMDALGLTGHADCLIVGNGACHVIDWKTGSHAEYPVIHEDAQLRAYAIMAMNEFDGMLSVSYARCHVDLDAIYAHSIDAEDFWSVIGEIRELLPDEPDFRPGGHCASCLQRANCSAVKGEALAIIDLASYGIGPVLDAASAQRLTDALPGLQALVDGARKALGDYVEEHGKVQTGRATAYTVRRTASYFKGATLENVTSVIGKSAAEKCVSMTKTSQLTDEELVALNEAGLIVSKTSTSLAIKGGGT